ncbi:DUF2236 domain-containing protein [Roseomonas terrae]|uniref:DUF2236 domain-containing protein n=2 Tax=Neoroseomonas terrae TaxID=424799 RepID=A0ABS5EP62_9PROT|nr:DUF2236 domain-containing protein [Neoroseomonas terrae]
MMLPPASMRFDFLHPSGEAALVGPDSLSWRIFKNPVTLFIGGVGAVILELAEPAVRSGVWDHSSFRQDAVTRLRRTGAAAMMTVYGPAGAAREMIARVVRMHDKVSGTTPDGQPYHANDERLLDWVQATASYGFIEAYSRFARPLSDAERSTAFAEGAPAAQLYGAVGAPLSTAEWEALFARTLPRLERSSIVFDFLSIMNEAPLLPRPMRWLQRMLVKAAIDIVPAVLRERLGIAQMTPSAPERAAARMMARIADRLPLREAPPAQASMRMGRDAAFLYR